MSFLNFFKDDQALSIAVFILGSCTIFLSKAEIILNIFVNKITCDEGDVGIHTRIESLKEKIMNLSNEFCQNIFNKISWNITRFSFFSLFFLWVWNIMVKLTGVTFLNFWKYTSEFYTFWCWVYLSVFIFFTLSTCSALLVTFFQQYLSYKSVTVSNKNKECENKTLTSVLLFSFFDKTVEVNQELNFKGKVEQTLDYVLESALWEINMTFIIFILPFLNLLILFAFWTSKNKTLYELSLFFSALNFVVSFFLFFLFDGRKSGFQYSCLLDIMPSINYLLHLGIDGVSLFFVLLTYLFIYFCILSLNPESPKLKESITHLFFLNWTVSLSFLFVDLLGFFLFFEMTLIPIYFLVIGWGSRERKVRASYLISLYTMFGSIFLFFNILYFYTKTFITEYEFLLTFDITREDHLFLWITFFLSFAAKIPVFPLHIWLPEAHVEAPTVGSVLLAVLLLKLGTYGLIRFSLTLVSEGTLYYSGWVVLFAIISIIYTCLIAIRQIDLKKIIAYSSVGHMNVVLLGIISDTSEGLQGAIFQMLSHGIVSGALFFAVGSLYERYTVRSLKYFGGLTYVYPLLSFIFLIFFLANISFPLTSSFIGEFLIFMGFFKQSFWGTFFASTSMVLGAVYTLWTYNRIFFGNIRILTITDFKDLTKKEGALFFTLVFFLFLMGLRPNLFLDLFLVDVLNILEHSKR